MNANELRIGNLIISTKTIGYYPSGIIEVESISKHGINSWQDMGASGWGKFEDLEGIELTAEILEAAGFEKEMQGHRQMYLFKIDQWRVYEFWWNDIGNFIPAVCIRTHDKDGNNIGNVALAWDIKHLHQLQNLYHSLTGSELKVSLTEKV